MKCNKHKNIWLNLLRKIKKKYYEDLKLSDVNDNRKFWKTIKPLFGNKIKSKSQIALAEGNNFVTNDKALTKTLNKFFVNIVATLRIKYEKLSSNYHYRKYNFDKLILRYNDRQSVLLKIKVCY